LKLLGLGGAAASDAEVINHTMVQPETRRHLVDFFASKTRGQLEKLAAKHDLPLHTLP
ncbi:MAG: hypothetical protein RL323_404, partial [Pseudomonadota bacterium]